MATTGPKIITDSLNLEIVGTFPLNKIDDVFVKLGFKQVDIDKRRYVAQLSSSLDRMITDLLNSWANKHGYGLDQAETLKDVMEKHGVMEAAKLIQEAIDKVIPPAVTGLLPDVTALPTSTKEKNSAMEH
eukprot:XP_011663679.1 PREDICTED: uncharacterized protein LOC105438052 [Strongylocentrotus purpuratus]